MNRRRLSEGVSTGDATFTTRLFVRVRNTCGNSARVETRVDQVHDTTPPRHAHYPDTVLSSCVTGLFFFFFSPRPNPALSNFLLLFFFRRE